MTVSALALAIVAAILALSLVALTAYVAYRRADEASKRLVKRVLRLPLAAKLKLAWRLFREPRVPLLARALPPLLVLYLALPLDIIPDFLPVLGHLDDVLVLALSVGLLLRLAPREVIDELVGGLEAPPPVEASEA